MFIEKSIVESVQTLQEGIFLIKVYAPSIASMAKPGQFCNIKVSETNFPLLRRPFSVCDVENDYIYFLFDIHGEGTKILSNKHKGDELELLGPLGKGFIYDGDYETAVIIAGGLGSAPFPFLTKKIPAGKKIISLVGARAKNLLVTYKLQNISVATDDGSQGFNGNVVEHLKSEFKNLGKNVRIFGCGPNAMLKGLQKYCNENNIDCQISVECAMACGFGICQGCPIDSADGESFLLVCKDGPVFNSNMVKL